MIWWIGLNSTMYLIPLRLSMDVSFHVLVLLCWLNYFSIIYPKEGMHLLMHVIWTVAVSVDSICVKPMYSLITNVLHPSQFTLIERGWPFERKRKLCLREMENIADALAVKNDPISIWDLTLLIINGLGQDHYAFIIILFDKCDTNCN